MCKATFLGSCVILTGSWFSQGICSEASGDPQKEALPAQGQEAIQTEQSEKGGRSEGKPLSAAKSWLATVQSGRQPELAQALSPPFLASGIDATTGPLRRRCLTLGEERAGLDFTLRLFVKTADDANLLAECLLEDRLFLSVLPEGTEAWSGKPDRRGKQATLRVVRTLPSELEPERKGLSAALSNPATRLVEFRGTDNRGISTVAVLIITESNGKYRATGLLVKTKFEH